ncbi:T-cell leukemia translocation-altered gene [Merluccius polli]|uniref:T-cell leukemia translocation-altered protein n=1 Tax=Merluccius polli TaxID=89951 RepID=A0AA47N096_MERPO|nr:T-cell leukemia translocation-altered gene [Merluccius polli]
MEESWDFEFLSRIADGCLSFLSEFIEDWLANDMRVSIFKILLGWLILSLVAIHFAWKVYGDTVNDMYYRQASLQKSTAADFLQPARGKRSAECFPEGCSSESESESESEEEGLIEVDTGYETLVQLKESEQGSTPKTGIKCNPIKRATRTFTITLL